MNLVRTVRLHRDLVLPNGARVKIEIDETAHVQHVHDQYGRTHATARPESVPILGDLGPLRTDRQPTNGGHRFATDEDLDLWVPLPPDVTALHQDATANPPPVVLRSQ